MLKKLLVVITMVVSGSVFADTAPTTNAVTTQPNNASVVTQPIVTPKGATVVNPASVGSKSGSNQIFGEPAITGEKGQKYYTKEQLSSGQNSADTGSKVGSNQVFGNPPVTGKKGQEYYTKEQIAIFHQ